MIVCSYLKMANAFLKNDQILRETVELEGVSNPLTCTVSISVYMCLLLCS